MTRQTRLSETDRGFLQEAIDEASNDPRRFKVGAVIAKGNIRLAKVHGGGEDGKTHAELLAIKQCLSEGKSLVGATLYTTLEPCNPEVRDPDKQPCAIAIANEPFSRVVIGVLDPNPRVRKYGVNLLQSKNLDVVLCDDYELKRQIRENSKEFFEQEWLRWKASPGFAPDQHFKGRWKEREKLTEWLCKRGEYGSLPIYVLWGAGGMGKSNLTWVWAQLDVAGEQSPLLNLTPNQAANRCKVEKGWKPLRVLWFSFYQYEGGRDFNAFLREALIHFSAGILEPEDYLWEGNIDYSRVQLEVVTLLQEMRCLIVWDGAERLLKEYNIADPALHIERRIEEVQNETDATYCTELRVAQFLKSIAAQATSKLLISSRLPFGDIESKAAAFVELKGLDSTDGAKFLLDLGINGPRSLLEQAVDDYEGHPLSLINLAASLKDDFEYQGDISGRRPEDLAKPQDQRRHHIFELAFDRRAAHRRQLLSRLSRVRGHIRKDIIELLSRDIPGLSENTLGNELNYLIKLGFIRRAKMIPDEDPSEYSFDFHPVTRKFVYERHDFEGERRMIHDRLREYYSVIGMTIDITTISEVNHLEPLIEEYYQMARSGQFDDAYKLFVDTRPGWGKRTMYQMLYHELCDIPLLIELILELFPRGLYSDPGISKAIHFNVLSQLGHSYFSRGDTEIAYQLYLRAKNCAENYSSNISSSPYSSILWTNIGLGFQQVGFCALSLGFIRGASKCFNDAKKFSSLTKNTALGAIITRERGKVLAFRGYFKKGKELTNQSLRIYDWALQSPLNASNIGQTVRARCVCLIQLSWIELFDHQLNEAIQYAKDAHDELTILQNRFEKQIDLEIEVRWVLGFVLLWSDLTTASEYLDAALILCRRSRYVEMEPLIMIARGWVCSRHAEEEKDQGKREEWILKGKELATDALRTARRCKYRLNEADAYNLLAQLHVQDGNKDEALTYATRAIERASCNEGSDKAFYYKPAYLYASNIISLLSS